MNEPETVRNMLALSEGTPRSLAVVGLSDDPGKPSHYVSAYMQRAGYRILPINPSLSEVLGERSYFSLRELPVVPDIVNVFRLPRFVPAIVEDMIALSFPNLWVQLGIVHAEAAARAEEAGLKVVMDRCIMVEHRRLVGGLR